MIPVVLFLLGAYAMLRWNASCGFTLGENVGSAKSGRACGAARGGVAILLPFIALVPAITRSPRQFYAAVGGVLVINLMVVIGLASGV